MAGQRASRPGGLAGETPGFVLIICIMTCQAYTLSAATVLTKLYYYSHGRPDRGPSLMLANCAPAEPDRSIDVPETLR